MQAVKLRPEEVTGVAVRSDWLLLWRVLPKGLPSTGDAGGRKRRVALINYTYTKNDTLLSKPCALRAAHLCWEAVWGRVDPVGWRRVGVIRQEGWILSGFPALPGWKRTPGLKREA